MLPLLSCFRSSATRIADCYNAAIAPAASNVSLNSTLKTTLDYETVLDAFFLYSLLLDHKASKTTHSDLQPFRLPHLGEQENRYDQVLEERNHRFALNGRKHWSHACDECFKIKTKPDGTKGKKTVSF